MSRREDIKTLFNSFTTKLTIELAKANFDDETIIRHINTLKETKDSILSSLSERPVPIFHTTSSGRSMPPSPKKIDDVKIATAVIMYDENAEKEEKTRVIPVSPRDSIDPRLFNGLMDSSDQVS